MNSKWTPRNFGCSLPWLTKVSFLPHRSSGWSCTGKTIAITLDDAYRSVYEEAYPRLKAKGYPFTVFVATDGVDENMPAYMSLDQVREMQKNGVLFANHSQNHDYLTRKKPGESQEAWKDRATLDITAAQK